MARHRGKKKTQDDKSQDEQSFRQTPVASEASSNSEAQAGIIAPMMPPQAFGPNQMQMVHPSQFLQAGSMPPTLSPYQPGYPAAFTQPSYPSYPSPGLQPGTAALQGGRYQVPFIPQHFLPPTPQSLAQPIPNSAPVTRIGQPLLQPGAPPTPSASSGWVPTRFASQGGSLQPGVPSTPSASSGWVPTRFASRGGTQQVGSIQPVSAVTGSSPAQAQGSNETAVRECLVPLPSIESAQEVASSNVASNNPRLSPQSTTAPASVRTHSKRSLSPDRRPRDHRTRSRGRSRRSPTPEVVRLRQRDDLQSKFLLTQLDEKDEQLRREREHRDRSRERRLEKEEEEKRAREQSRQRAREKSLQRRRKEEQEEKERQARERSRERSRERAREELSKLQAQNSMYF